MSKKETKRAIPALILGILAVYLVIAAAIQGASRPDLIPIFNVVLVAGLVAMTAFYAYFTLKMADEMKEQRLSEARPYLLLRLNGEAVQWDKDEQGKLPPSEFGITIRNVGKGPAINLWAARWSHGKSFFGDSKGYLAPNEEWVTCISKAPTLGIKKDIWLPELREVIENKYPGIVAVKYSDIHHRTWTSYLCLDWHHSVGGYVMEGEQNIVKVKGND